MNEKDSRASKWLSQRDAIPEMGLRSLIRILKEGFGILSEAEPRRNDYSVRFTNLNPEFRSLRVTTHNKNGVSVSPLCIKQVLAKFEIDETEFKKVYNRILIGQPFRATGTDDSAPT